MSALVQMASTLVAFAELLQAGAVVVQVVANLLQAAELVMAQQPMVPGATPEDEIALLRAIVKAQRAVMDHVGGNT